LKNWKNRKTCVAAAVLGSGMEVLKFTLASKRTFAEQKKAHPAFAVAQITLLADILKANDHAVLWDTSIPERRRFFTTDPVGNRIEFMEILHKA